jgi:ethanolamine utilization microcompartment shell protein EutL
MSRAALATIDTAAHFMIATHPNEVGRLIAQHVHRAEGMLNATAAVREMAAMALIGGDSLQ